jgi:hypothetical protein
MQIWIEWDEKASEVEHRIWLGTRGYDPERRIITKRARYSQDSVDIDRAWAWVRDHHAGGRVVIDYGED